MARHYLHHWHPVERHGHGERRRTRSKEHSRFIPISESPRVSESTSPLYLIQTNVPDSPGARGYGLGSGGAVHMSEGGLWSHSTGPASLLRRSPPVSGWLYTYKHFSYIYIYIQKTMVQYFWFTPLPCTILQY